MEKLQPRHGDLGQPLPTPRHLPATGRVGPGSDGPTGLALPVTWRWQQRHLPQCCCVTHMLPRPDISPGDPTAPLGCPGLWGTKAPILHKACPITMGPCHHHSLHPTCSVWPPSASPGVTSAQQCLQPPSLVSTDGVRQAPPPQNRAIRLGRRDSLGSGPWPHRTVAGALVYGPRRGLLQDSRAEFPICEMPT
ncbi:hypothetical protein P7K49_032934 [Saguinus oedipus]|uniref:Uncharacterized protein n=1 Tax=Saguinus oedipus TaxID=9490 RepID=A0ABQ9TQH1_SAGOE|nr:hypothetical protein P7K49_032934 [Saguinus oedipus]